MPSKKWLQLVADLTHAQAMIILQLHTGPNASTPLHAPVVMQYPMKQSTTSSLNATTTTMNALSFKEN